MPRPPVLPDRATIPPDELEAYDSLVAREQSMGNEKVPQYWAAVVNWPAYGASLAVQGRLIRTAGEREGTYSHADREWVDQVLCHDWGTNIVLKMHIPDALAVGVRLEAIEALRSGREQDLSEDEQFLTEFIRHVDRGTMTDEAWNRMEERIGVQGTVEYVTFITHLIRTIRLHQALGVDDPTDAEMDELIADFREGRRELPDFRKRIR